MTCTVCRHPERAAVDAAIVAGDANRRIATRHGLSEAAVRRHKDGHLPGAIVKAHAAAETVQADTLLSRLRALNRETADVLKAAKDEHNHELVLKAIQRAEKQIELEGRLLGELQDGQTVNLLLAPEWPRVVGALTAALAAHPAARVAVGEALAALEAAR